MYVLYFPFYSLRVYHRNRGHWKSICPWLNCTNDKAWKGIWIFFSCLCSGSELCWLNSQEYQIISKFNQRFLWANSWIRNNLLTLPSPMCFGPLPPPPHSSHCICNGQNICTSLNYCYYFILYWAILKFDALKWNKKIILLFISKNGKMNAQKGKAQTGRLYPCKAPTQGNERIWNIYKYKQSKS